jgi:thiosulfate/3-mercaptopyruvate sulfurtransferase
MLSLIYSKKKNQMNNREKLLKSVQWLQENLEYPDLIILDASGSPEQGIKGARIFDLKQIFQDTDAEFPNTIPSASDFEVGCQALGINRNSLVVIYDKKGIYTSPRVWWLFKTMGFQNAFVLDGGFPAWEKDGYAIENLTEKVFAKGDFKSELKSQYVKHYGSILSNLSDKKYVVIDARSNGRFNGTEPEPRKTLQSGKIPNSISIPYTSVLENGKFKSDEALNTVFSSLKTENRPLTFSCGSGITACIVLLAFELVHESDTSVYDGSWTEWATLQGLIQNNSGNL